MLCATEGKDVTAGIQPVRETFRSHHATGEGFKQQRKRDKDSTPKTRPSHFKYRLLNLSKFYVLAPSSCKNLMVKSLWTKLFCTTQRLLGHYSIDLPHPDQRFPITDSRNHICKPPVPHKIPHHSHTTVAQRISRRLSRQRLHQSFIPQRNG